MSMNAVKAFIYSVMIFFVQDKVLKLDYAKIDFLAVRVLSFKSSIHFHLRKERQTTLS